MNIALGEILSINIKSMATYLVIYKRLQNFQKCLIILFQLKPSRLNWVMGSDIIYKYDGKLNIYR